MRGARLQEPVGFGAGPGHRDGRGAQVGGDLDGRQTDAAGGGRDDHGIAGLQSPDFDQGAVGGEGGHPDGRAGHGVHAVWAADQPVRRHDGPVAVDPVDRHPVVVRLGHDADRVTDGDSGHARPDGFHDAGGLGAQARGGQHRVVVVPAGAQEHLAPVEAERVDAHPHLAGTGLTDLHVREVEHLGTAKLVEQHCLGFHHANPLGLVFRSLLTDRRHLNRVFAVQRENAVQTLCAVL